MPNSTLKEIKACRICESPELVTVIDLGEQHIAGRFIKGETPGVLERRYPLELVRCAGPSGLPGAGGETGCGLVQLRHSLDPSLLYTDYGYHSGINQTMRDNLTDIARKATRMVKLKKGDLVVDIGCNDGTLLSAYEIAGLDRLGFDPAENVAELAKSKKLEVVVSLFSAAAFERARPRQKARVITSIAMFYDLERPADFVHDAATLLADDGVWVIELSYLPFMLERSAFDTICHEHQEYYTLRQMEWMLDRAGLEPCRLEFNDINGGSIRLFIRKKGAAAIAAEDRRLIDEVRAKEIAGQLHQEAPYERFRQSVRTVRNDLKGMVEDLAKSGKSVYVYGASTKGNTILEYCGIDAKLIRRAADRNPMKWGRHTLGTNIPIISEEEARAQNPDYFLVLPWHFFKEFAWREIEFLKRGGKFILPLPEVRVIGAEEAAVLGERRWNSRAIS